MAAIDTALVAREALNTLGKRSWPSENAGVMVVFVIVFLGMQLCFHTMTLLWLNLKTRPHLQITTEKEDMQERKKPGETKTGNIDVLTSSL